MTTFAAVLCLFGFMLFSAAPVYADRQENFQECKDMKWTEGKKAKKNCFRDLAKSYPRTDLKKRGYAVCKGMTWGEEKGDKKMKSTCFSDLVVAVGSAHDSRKTGARKRSEWKKIAASKKDAEMKKSKDESKKRERLREERRQAREEREELERKEREGR